MGVPIRRTSVTRACTRRRRLGLVFSLGTEWGAGVGGTGVAMGGRRIGCLLGLRIDRTCSLHRSTSLAAKLS